MKITLANGREFSLPVARVILDGYQPTRIELEPGDFANIGNLAAANYAAFRQAMTRLDEILVKSKQEVRR